MIIAILVGGYFTFFTSPSTTDIERGGKGLEDLNKFVADVVKNQNENNLSEADNYVIKLASSGWKGEPFVKPQLFVKPEEPEEDDEEEEEIITAQQLKLIYSGYLEVIDKKLAIINGIEYEIGEKLDNGDYYVKKIFPNRVVIGIQKGKQELIIPLDETDTISFTKIE